MTKTSKVVFTYQFGQLEAQVVGVEGGRQLGLEGPLPQRGEDSLPVAGRRYLEHRSELYLPHLPHALHLPEAIFVEVL